MTVIAHIATYWTVNANGENEPYFVGMMTGDKWADVTGTVSPPPDPNTIVLEAIIDDLTFNTVSSDNDLYVMWDAPNPRPPDDIPGAAEFGLLRAYLAQNGWKQAQINQAIGQGVNGRNRRQIADELRTYIKGLTP